jgi:signal transduction histidine kinase
MRCVQVLYELVSNAFKFSTGAVELTATVSEGCAVISVQDRGCGIPPDQISQVWGPFHQVPGEQNRDTCGRGDGVGLGLYLVGTVASFPGSLRCS